MSETIKVRKGIYDILGRIAKELGLSSPEKALETIVLEKAGIPKDMFGVDKERLSPCSEKDKIEDRG